MITFEEVVVDLRAIVADHGEHYIYPRWSDGTFCVYVRDGKSSCIVGKWLERRGMDLEKLAVLDRAGDLGGSISFTDAFNRGMIPFDLEPKAVELLSSVQRNQDNAEPWGIAVDDGIERVEGFYA